MRPTSHLRDSGVRANPWIPSGALNDTTPEAEKATKRFAVLFVATLFAYITIYSGCEMWRLRGGAYTLRFDLATNGTPILQLQHRRLLPGGPMTLTFPGESAPRLTNPPVLLSYDKPYTNDTPFGPMVFINTTDLPGTLALNAFGHAVELIPRRVLLDFAEIPWVSGTNVVVGTNKPSPEKLSRVNQTWGGR
jgi:hypothetical protein